MEDDRPEEDAAGSVAPAGPRRSTFTPPPAGSQYRPGSLTEGEGAAPIAVPAPSPIPEAAVPSALSASPVSAPVGNLDPPRRASLTDEALFAAADPSTAQADTGTLISLVEQQLSLRAEEAERLQQWERAVYDAGVPDAYELVQSVRSSFTGVIDLIPLREGATGGGGNDSDVNDPWARYPGTRTPPPRTSDDREPPNAPAVGSGLLVPAPPTRSQLSAAPPPVTGTDVPPEFASAPSALAAAPPPYGLVPSAVTPPPADDDTADIPLVLGSAPVASSDPTPVPLVQPEPTTTGVTDLDRLVASIPDTSEGSVVPATSEENVVPASADGAPDPTPDDDARPTVSPVPLNTGAPRAVAPPETFAFPAAPIPIPSTQPPRDPATLPVEEAALEPTPAALRAGRSLRLFWLWFSVSASAVSIGLGGVLLGLGMSLRQAILSALIGVAVSFLPLGLGTLAGKWSGQPTMVVSRATFGIVGNLLPAGLAVLTRLLWAAALLWMLGTGTASALAPLGADPSLVAPLAAFLALVLAALIAGVGFGFIVRTAAVASALAAVLLVGLVVLTAPRIDIPQALTIPDGDWVLIVTGAVLVFSVVGLAWAQSSGDLARYQSRATLGIGAVMWTGFGATVPAFLLVCWGALLAASDPALAIGLATDPVGALAGLLPAAATPVLVAAIALSLVLAAALALYSGGFALLTMGLRAARWSAVFVASVIAGLVLAAFAVAALPLDALLRDVLTTVAVPVAAWAGIFGAETMIRTRRVHSPSLLRSGGVYGQVRWVNLVMLVVATAIGWGFTSAQLAGLGWQGYLWNLLGTDAALASSDAGVAFALAIGLAVPLVAGFPALRRLQAAERVAADS